MSIVIFVEYTPKEGQKDALLEALTSNAHLVHAEQGCEKYAFHSSKDKVYLIESWASKEDLGAHAQAEPLQKIREATADLLAEEPKLTMLRPAPSGDAQKGQLV